MILYIYGHLNAAKMIELKRFVFVQSCLKQSNIQNYCMTEVKKLLNVLQNSFTHQNERQFYNSTRAGNDNDNEQQHYEELKADMSKHYRPSWKLSGIPQRKERLPVLKNKQLDNWQIARMSLSKRSYAYPKNYHGLKIPSIGKDFTRYESKDGEGHYPYLYEGEIQKLKKLKDQLHQSTFSRTNTVKHEYFGLGKLRPNLSETTKKQSLSCSTY